MTQILNLNVEQVGSCKVESLKNIELQPEKLKNLESWNGYKFDELGVEQVEKKVGKGKS